MWKLLKEEIKYYKFSIIMACCPPLLYTLSVIYDVHFFENTYFLKRYFWMFLAGAVPYMILFFMWKDRQKELRERLLATLPVTTKQISAARILSIMLPFAIITGYLFVVHICILPENMEETIRIFAQLGIFMMFLPQYWLIKDLWYIQSRDNKSEKFMYAIIAGVLLLALTIVCVFVIGIKVYRNYFNTGEEILFFIWGAVLLIASYFSFTKRKSCLF